MGKKRRIRSGNSKFNGKFSNHPKINNDKLVVKPIVEEVSAIPKKEISETIMPAVKEVAALPSEALKEEIKESKPVVEKKKTTRTRRTTVNKTKKTTTRRTRTKKTTTSKE